MFCSRHECVFVNFLFTFDVNRCFICCFHFAVGVNSPVKCFSCCYLSKWTFHLHSKFRCEFFVLLFVWPIHDHTVVFCFFVLFRFAFVFALSMTECLFLRWCEITFCFYSFCLFVLLLVWIDLSYAFVLFLIWTDLSFA